MSVLAVYKVILPDRIPNLREADAVEKPYEHESDKKMEAGKVKFILLNSIGDACIDRSVTDQEMEDAVKYLENITLL